MNNKESVLLKFIEQMAYRENLDVEGIIFYGSSYTGYHNNNSDLDVYVIFNESVNEIIKGTVEINGKKIDYVERTLTNIYNILEKDFKSQENMLLSIIGYGKIIMDRTGSLKKLKKDVIECFSKPLPLLNIEQVKNKLIVVYEQIKKLKELSFEPENDIFFQHLYHLTIDKIQRLYHQMRGFPKLPTLKVYRVYDQNSNYFEAIKKTRPEKEFIDLYKESLSLIVSKNEKIKMLEKMFNYISKDIKIDYSNYRIIIK